MNILETFMLQFLLLIIAIFKFLYETTITLDLI